MVDLDEVALSLPHTTKDVSDDAGRRTWSIASSSAVIAAVGATRSIRRPVSASTTC